MKSDSIILLSFVLVLSFIISACAEQKKESPESPRQGRELDFVEKVSFINAEGAVISTIDAALADDPQERNQGLMDVTDLPPNAGMLFIFPDEAQRSFYMANTPLPLDIIFVNADSTIVRIHHNTTPFNERQLPSDKPAKFVVETNGGYCVSNDIQEGMKIRF